MKHGIKPQYLQSIYTCFLESMIPHKVDITLYEHISYPPLKRHIDFDVK